MATKIRRDWSKIDPLIDNLKAQGWNDTQIAKDLGIGRQTLVDHLRTREPVTPIAHPNTLDHSGVPQPELDLPESAHQSTPERTEPSEVHPGTPEEHQNVSPGHSGIPMAHSGVPARQDRSVSTPMVHPSTPTAEDWQLWNIMKGRWEDVEKMLADWQTRHTLLRAPTGTPRHTMKKTYVVDSLYVELIDRYAQEQGVELKDVVNLAFHEFFERRELLPQERKTP
jgi:hypothetical protein